MLGETNIRSGVSVDQMIANHVGQDTPQSSIVLACEQPMTGYHETNFSMAYSSHISWQTADSPVPNEVYPSLAFDTLFENRGSLLNISILDRVKERADRLSRKISSDDRNKLDEYMTSVREVEKRVDGMRKNQDLSWSQVVMAANTPMLLKAAMVDGRPDLGVMSGGQVVGVIDDLPTCEELIDRVVTEADVRAVVELALST